MADKKTHCLKESKVFCMAPWVHVHSLPNGKIMPCCISGHSGDFGNLYQDSIENIWNNDAYKTLRLKLLNDIPVDECTRCYKEESWGNEWTYRKSFNAQYENKYQELVEQLTDEKGYLSKMKFLRWDFRFSNLCNLACTTCSPTCSSAWVDVIEKMGWDYQQEKFKTSKQDLALFVNTIKTQADAVDNIYLAGGEPLIQAEHYEILKQIDDIDRLDKINFTYSTNLTSLTYKSTSVMYYWNRMANLKVLVSLDDIDAERLYYIRYPAKLNVIIDNIKILNENFNRANLHLGCKRWTLTPTWSLMNIHRIKEISIFFKENNLLPNIFFCSSEWESDFHNIILTQPYHLAISVAPIEWKNYIRSKLDEYTEWYLTDMISLKQDFIKKSATTIFLNNVKRFYNALDEPGKINSDAHKEWYSRLDKARDTDFAKTFPELAWHVQ